MTFTDVVSLIGTLVGIAVAVGGLMTYILKQNPSRKQVSLVSTAIGITLVCVVILAEGISHLSTKSTSAQTQKTTMTSVTATVHVSLVTTVYVSPVATAHISAAGIISEFPLPDSHSGAYEIETGPDGNLWFTENHGLGRISPGGTISEFPLQANDIPMGLTIGPDGNLWFTDNVTNSNGTISENKIGHISPSGTITEFTLPNSNSNLVEVEAITTGSDGNLWFTIDKLTGSFPIFGEGKEGKIGRISPNGTFTEFPLPNSSSGAYAITTGSDGNLWFTENVVNFNNGSISESKIGRISLSGTFTEFPLPNSRSSSYAITKGPDGNLWFTESVTNFSNGNISESKIGRISPNGTFTEFPLPNSMDISDGITTGPDGNVWFTEYRLDSNDHSNKGEIGYVSSSGTFTEFPLPNSSIGPESITTGPDRNLWFTENEIGNSSNGVSGSTIGHITSGK